MIILILAVPLFIWLAYRILKEEFTPLRKIPIASGSVPHSCPCMDFPARKKPREGAYRIGVKSMDRFSATIVVLVTEILHFFYQWLFGKFNIPPPPGNPPGIWTFEDWLVQIPSPRGKKAVQMPHQLVLKYLSTKPISSSIKHFTRFSERDMP